MNRLLLIFAACTQIAFAQSAPPNQADAKAWMIRYFQIPPDAKILQFAATGEPVTSAVISWEVIINGETHTYVRAYDFERNVITQQADF